jgi:hypothetical protein
VPKTSSAQRNAEVLPTSLRHLPSTSATNGPRRPAIAPQPEPCNTKFVWHENNIQQEWNHTATSGQRPTTCITRRTRCIGMGVRCQNSDPKFLVSLPRAPLIRVYKPKLQSRGCGDGRAPPGFVRCRVEGPQNLVFRNRPNNTWRPQHTPCRGWRVLGPPGAELLDVRKVSRGPRKAHESQIRIESTGTTVISVSLHSVGSMDCRRLTELGFWFNCSRGQSMPN